MPRALIALMLTILFLVAASAGYAEISVSITSVVPADQTITDGESVSIFWKIEADSESGDWRFEIGGDGTWDSGEKAGDSDASGTFSGTMQGQSTIHSSDLDEDDGDYSVYFIAYESDESNDSTSVTITLDNPPDMVTDVTAGNGNNKLFVGWTQLDTTDIDHYLVYYSLSSGNDAIDYQGTDAAEGASPVDAGNTAELTLSALQNDTKYFIRVSAVDEGGTEGPLSAEVGSTPRENFGVSELTNEEGGCFIATAAFGNYSHPSVVSLREFRDRILLKNNLGKRLIQSYYKWSPPLADWIRVHPGVRATVATALIPLAWYANASVGFPLFALLIPVLVALAFFWSMRYVAIRVRVRRRGK